MMRSLSILVVLSSIFVSQSNAGTVTPPAGMGSTAIVNLEEKDGAKSLYNLMSSRTEHSWVEEYPEDHITVERTSRNTDTAVCKKIADSRSQKQGQPKKYFYTCSIGVKLVEPKKTEPNP